MLCDTAQNCNLFRKNRANYYINPGTCRKFLDEHRTYCNKVYALDKKVARASEEEELKIWNQR